MLIEVLATGRIILAANNGGNRYFVGRSSGVVLFSGEQDFVEKIEWIQRLPQGERCRMEENNRRLYRSEFQLEDFGRRYAAAISTIEANRRQGAWFACSARTARGGLGYCPGVQC